MLSRVAPVSGWQDELERAKALAAREGRLVIYSSAGPALRDPLTRIFEDKFDVSLEWVAGRNNELAQRVFSEQRAGLFAADIYLSGISALTLKGDNALESLDPVLFLPEVLEKKSWYGGELFFADAEHSWVAFSAFPQPHILVNTQMVKPGEIRGWQDLLDPRWKGRIALYDPRDGSGLHWAYHVSEVVMSRDYLRRFIGQNPVIAGDSRRLCECVGQGKYPIGVAARTESVSEIKRSGAPVELVSPVEGVHLTAAAGGLALFRKAVHPGAAKVFINWALTRDGGEVLSRLTGGQSARIDVPTDFLDPMVVRRPGVKYYNTMTEVHNKQILAFAKVVTEMFEPLTGGNN